MIPAGEYVVDIAENYGDATPDAADKSSTVSSSTRRRVPTSPGRRPASRTPWKASGADSRSSATTAPDSGIESRSSSFPIGPLMMPSSRR